MLATITIQVDVVNISISAYPLLSAYFLSTYAYKCVRLITRVYGTLIKEWYGGIEPPLIVILSILLCSTIALLVID